MALVSHDCIFVTYMGFWAPGGWGCVLFLSLSPDSGRVPSHSRVGGMIRKLFPLKYYKYNLFALSCPERAPELQRWTCQICVTMVGQGAIEGWCPWSPPSQLKGWGKLRCLEEMRDWDSRSLFRVPLDSTEWPPAATGEHSTQVILWGPWGHGQRLSLGCRTWNWGGRAP